MDVKYNALKTFLKIAVYTTVVHFVFILILMFLNLRNNHFFPFTKVK